MTKENKKNTSMEKKKKKLEKLEKFQLKNEKSKTILAGTGGSSGYVAPSWAPTTQTCAGNCHLDIYPDGTSLSSGDSISLDWD